MGVRLLILLFLTPFTAASPKDPVIAVEGGSAFLNCTVDNQRSVESSTVEWSKEGLEGRVHLHKHTKDQVYDQDKEFRGRTTLDREGLKRGNVTLELHPVRMSDDGQYVCYIRRLEYRCYIILRIVSSGQNNMSKGENSSTTVSPDEDNQCESGCRDRNFGRAIVPSIVFLLFIIAIVILIILFTGYREGMKSKMKRPGEENQPMFPKPNPQGASLSPSSSTPEISINQASAPHLVTHTDTHG